MLKHEDIVRVVDRYVQTFEAGDPEIAVSLYAEDGNLQDPIGSDTIQGTEAIRAFYRYAVSLDVRIRLKGPVRTVENYAAFPFTITRRSDNCEFDVIDTFKFNDAGKIAEMRAYWSEANLRPLPE